ncbi:MAG: porin family protein [Chlamydiia bacterium]|nr:porin family protein [Chlamydiia bacterium]
MKKFLILALATLGLKATSLTADNFYVSAFGGGTYIQDDEKYIDFTYNLGYTYGGSMGYRWGCSGWRVEAEFAYSKNRIKRIEGFGFDLDVNAHQSYYRGMGNIIYDFCIPTSYAHPFVGVGAGWYQQKIDLYNFNVKDDDIAWQALAGLSYEINTCYSLDIVYVMFKPKDDFYVHNARLVLRYNF